MGKNNNKNSNTAKQAVTPKPTAKPAEAKKEKEDVIIPEEVKDTPAAKKKDTGLLQINVGRGSTNRLSPDSKAQLAVLMQERYARNPEQTIVKYGHEFLTEMEDNIDVMVVLALADVRQECLETGIPLIAKGSGKSLLALNAACEILGIQLPKEQLKLANKNPEKEVVVDLTEATVLEKTDTAIKKDQASRKEFVVEMPELEPTKVKDAESLEKTLRYLLTKQGFGIGKNIIYAIDFMKEYRGVNAPTSEDKAALAKRTIGEWVEDILSVTQPSLVVSGIVKAVNGLLGKHGNVVMAHAVLTSQLKGQDAVCPISDEEVANLLRVFVKIAHQYSLPSIDADGKEVKEDLLDTRAVKAIYNGSVEEIGKIMSLTEPEHKAAYYKTIGTFYGIDSKDMPLYSGTDFKELARMKIGQVMNLYLTTEEKMSLYPGVPSLITEFPQKAIKPSTTEAAAVETQTVVEKKK